jgi:MYXO-CTERM domain-containing protein
MKTNHKAILAAVLAGSLEAGSAFAATPYLITWDNGPVNSTASPYILGPGEAQPSGVVNSRLGINTFAVAPPGAAQGGLALDNRGAWTGNGYQFNESVAGGMTGTFTYEANFYLVATNNVFGASEYPRGLIWENASTGGNRGISVRLDPDPGPGGNYSVNYWIDPLGGGGGMISLTSGYVVELDRWYHVGVVHDGTGARIYLNNQLIASNASAIGGRTVIGTDSFFWVGTADGANERTLGGWLDSFAISNVALDPNSWAIPEPSVAALAGLAALALVSRRRQ